jgi:hypothetical protein
MARVLPVLPLGALHPIVCYPLTGSIFQSSLNEMLSYKAHGATRSSSARSAARPVGGTVSTPAHSTQPSAGSVTGEVDQWVWLIRQIAAGGGADTMATFLTIGYGDEAGYERTGKELKDAAHAHDAWLIERGAVMGNARQPLQVRNHQDRGVRVEHGAYMQSELPIAGFALIEASTAEEAVELVAKTPCAIAYGVVEVWSLDNPEGDG